ncbi:hypothetical protein ACFYXH_31520 [Streptomyces sp. NPDC002730]|uniref:hypothetical protein n=1 Tax=Streptomyces sp. NPDC002730 TaxID=3364662 RepID=UPI0036B7DBA9
MVEHIGERGSERLLAHGELRDALPAGHDTDGGATPHPDGGRPAAELRDEVGLLPFGWAPGKDVRGPPDDIPQCVCTAP